MHHLAGLDLGMGVHLGDAQNVSRWKVCLGDDLEPSPGGAPGICDSRTRSRFRQFFMREYASAKRGSVARAACAKLLEAFFTNGGEMVWLSAGGAGSLPLYQGLGFEICGTQVNLHQPTRTTVR